MAEAGRPRLFARIALVRLVVFFIVLALVYGGGHALLSYIAHHLVPAQFVNLTAVAGAIVVSLIGIAAYLLLVRAFERRWPKELAPLRGTPLLLGGLAAGLAVFVALYAVFWGLGLAHSMRFAGFAGVASFAGMAIGSGIGEELLFRGGVFRILEDSFGTTVALVLSGALFGALHLTNPHASLFSAAAIALEAGVLLGAAYAATRSLWLPIGIHIGWNFTEGGVFGAAVSGNGAGRGMLDVPLSGPPLLTGGEFGPEASVIAIAVCSLLGLYFVVLTIRRHRWVPLSFHMVLD
jgi:membrane protease YdiL (CAAX protease family)